jgi:CRP/FNR family cyclic AMP-dependent transcriptional regulator
MRKVLFLFGQLSDADVAWLAKSGRRQRLPAGTVLIHEGVPVQTLYILLEGSLTVVQDATKREIARLGAGEVVGEMSFIDARPPSATVRAATQVVVYAIATEHLRRALEENVALAAHFYKAIATLLSDRVRKATAGQLGLDADEADELDDTVLDSVGRAGERFDELSRRLLDG